MIFVSEIYGVGKSYFCNIVKDKLGLKSYSASQLISASRNKGFSEDKLVPDIDDNQPLLLSAIDALRKANKEFILDGHFCLLNAEGAITRISLDTYLTLQRVASMRQFARYLCAIGEEAYGTVYTSKIW